MTFLLFFPAYLSYSYMVLDIPTVRYLHGYGISFMLGAKKQDFWPKIKYTQRILLYFVNTMNKNSSKSAQIYLTMQKIILIFFD